MKVDYLVIGQGICGTLLSRELIMAGKTVMVIDDGAHSSSSRSAGGIINPVTGKRLVSSWLIEDLLSFAQTAYTGLEQQLRCPLIRQYDILDFYPSQDVKDIFNERQIEGNTYLKSQPVAAWEQYFRFNYGIGKIAPCLLVDIRSMLDGWRQKLRDTNSIVEKSFIVEQLLITADAVTYNDITADKILFCDGVNSNNSPYFDLLPWSKDKGEALIVSIPGLPHTNIFKQSNISIVPWQDGLFWVGAAHDWKYTDMQPSLAFRSRVEEQLNYWLKLPYTIVDHLVALRPANVDRKPFIGLHPKYTSVGIFNGMGGKGCSVAPYFAHQFALHLVHGAPLLPDVDIKRFARILSRR